jgi:putrescine aminotransferase
MNLPVNTRPTADYQAMDAAHHWHPFTDSAELAAAGARVIESANGVWLTEAGGKRLIDGMAGLWCMNVGYGRDEIVDAVARQMRQLPYYNTFFQSTHAPAAEFATALTDMAPPQMNRVFFTNSGSESNDTAYRLARVYWQSVGKPQKHVIIGRKNGYHGSTVLGAALGGMSGMHAHGGDMLQGVRHINQPYWFGEGRATGMTQAEFGLARARELEAMIDEVGEENVCAFIAEPIQGAGGVIIPPETYWPEISRICREREILLIADEVICGFGRTGSWWGSDTYGIVADLMPIAKGMTSGYQPMGGVLISDRVAGPVMANAGEFAHGFTYSGHPAACAAGLEVLRIMREEKLVERCAEVMAPQMASLWAGLGDHPLVGEARTKGMLGALELVADKTTGARFADEVNVGGLCRDLCVSDAGLVMRAVGPTMIASPPLVISEDELDEMAARARKALDLAADRLVRDGHRIG